MRIGLDVSQAVFGTGVSDYTINLVRALEKVDPNNEYVLFGSSLRRNDRLKTLFPRGKIYRYPPMLLHYLWNRLHLVNIENFTGGVDVFHTSDWTEPPASCPKVTTVHDLSAFVFPDEMASGAFRNITAVHRARMRWVARESKKVICVSRSTAGDLERLFRIDPSRIEIIPEALPDRFSIKAGKKEISSVKKSFALDDYVLTIGTPQPRKNITLLVKSYLRFRSRYRLPQKLVVVGGHGWGVTDIPDDPSLIFTGYLPDHQVGALLAGAQVFALPSLYEGFGLPVLMSFYHRVPAVVSNSSSLPEVAGDAAVLVDPKDMESIASGISRAIKSRQSLVPAGIRQLSKFSWKDTAGKTLLVYSQLC